MVRPTHRNNQKQNMKIENIKTESLVPYARNAKTHPPAQVARIAGSIKEFGFCNPVLVDKDNGIIAGHGRVLAAQKLGLKEVPCIRLGHLTDAQRRAYILADNRLSETDGSGWDMEMLKLELADLGELDVDLEGIGFGADDLADLDLDMGAGEGGKEENYSRKIEAPIYEPQGPKPSLPEMFDDSKTRKLCAAIEASDIPKEEKAFLIAAAQRHTVFRFDKIAEYYAQSDPALQRLFEDSALVIIDFDKAIEDGFVLLTERLQKLTQ
jgi:hypothetical protein